MSSVAPLRGDDPRATVFLGLGTNIARRRRFLARALFALATHPEIELCAVSRIWETEYNGPGRQASYLNACVRVETALTPFVLLSILKMIENRMGRRPDSHMQPRPIDLDILLYDDCVMQSKSLTLPHAGLRQRAFVLAPLVEIAADQVLPDSGETVGDVYERMAADHGPWVRPYLEGDTLPGPTAGREDNWIAALALHCR